MDVDPLRTFGSGALLAAVPTDRLDEAMTAVTDAGVEAAVIGEVLAVDESADETKPDRLVLDGTSFADPPRDDLYALWEAADT